MIAMLYSFQLKQDMFYQILFGGDQLTVARARGSQHIRMNSDTAVDRLLGLIPVTEDWHTSVVLLGVRLCSNNNGQGVEAVLSLSPTFI